ncbi:hypothetical protein [Chromobacterium paludis]|nr:hypothetical protein [Chromobacterium paludis]
MLAPVGFSYDCHHLNNTKQKQQDKVQPCPQERFMPWSSLALALLVIQV